MLNIIFFSPFPKTEKFHSFFNQQKNKGKHLRLRGLLIDIYIKLNTDMFVIQNAYVHVHTVNG